MEEGDLEFVYPQWKMPQDISGRLKDEHSLTPRVQVCVISDEKGNLRVQELTKLKDRAPGKLIKLTRSIKNSLG